MNKINPFVAVMVLIYDAALLGGTAYLVEEKHWSMWTFLLAMFFFLTIKSNNDIPMSKTQKEIFHCKDC